MLPDYIHSESELEETLAEPSEADLACVRRVAGDVLILGAGGKMGPSLARRVRRAAERTGARSRCAGGVAVLVADRFARSSKPTASRRSRATCSIAPASPRCRASPQRPVPGRPQVRHARSDRLTWATNTVVPARVAEHFHDSRMVVFSTGNVYPLVAGERPGSTEDDPPAPVGEYAQSCLGRERVVEFVSREHGLRALIFRLNYAVDLRYGTLVDIARRVFADEADRPDRRVLQCDLAGRREQLRAAQPRAVLVAAGRCSTSPAPNASPFATPRSGSARRSDARRGS